MVVSRHAVFHSGPARGRRLSQRVAAIVLVAAVAPVGADLALETGDGGVPPPERILETMARVADLYYDEALSFACDETVYYAGKEGRPSLHRFRYIYRYSGPEQRLRDYRVPRGKGTGFTQAEGDDPSPEIRGVPVYLLRAYSWIFIFERGVQDRYHFEILGEDEVLGRPAIRIRFEALAPFVSDINEWYGTMLVDRESYQPLRVEAVRVEDRDQQVMLEKNLRALRDPESERYYGSYTFTRYTTDFDVEKNGMRFPGIVEIKRAKHAVTGGSGKRPVRESPIFRVTQTYKKYRFFSVRTVEQIRGVVFGD